MDVSSEERKRLALSLRDFIKKRGFYKKGVPFLPMGKISFFFDAFPKAQTILLGMKMKEFVFSFGSQVGLRWDDSSIFVVRQKNFPQMMTVFAQPSEHQISTIASAIMHYVAEHGGSIHTSENAKIIQGYPFIRDVIPKKGLKKFVFTHGGKYGLRYHGQKDPNTVTCDGLSSLKSFIGAGKSFAQITGFLRNFPSAYKYIQECGGVEIFFQIFGCNYGLVVINEQGMIAPIPNPPQKPPPIRLFSSPNLFETLHREEETSPLIPTRTPSPAQINSASNPILNSASFPFPNSSLSFIDPPPPSPPISAPTPSPTPRSSPSPSPIPSPSVSPNPLPTQPPPPKPVPALSPVSPISTEKETSTSFSMECRICKTQPKVKMYMDCRHLEVCGVCVEKTMVAAGYLCPRCYNISGEVVEVLY